MNSSQLTVAFQMRHFAEKKNQKPSENTGDVMEYK